MQSCSFNSPGQLLSYLRGHSAVTPICCCQDIIAQPEVVLLELGRRLGLDGQVGCRGLAGTGLELGWGGRVQVGWTAMQQMPTPSSSGGCVLASDDHVAAGSW